MSKGMRFLVGVVSATWRWFSVRPNWRRKVTLSGRWLFLQPFRQDDAKEQTRRADL